MKQYEVLYLFRALNHNLAQKLQKISYVKFIQTNNELDNVYIYVEVNKDKLPVAKICGDFKVIGIVSEAEIQRSIQKQKSHSAQLKVKDNVLYPSEWNDTPFTITNIKNQIATLEYKIKDKIIKTQAKTHLLQKASNDLDIFKLSSANTIHTYKTLYIDCDSIEVVDLAEFIEFLILSIIRLQFAFNAKRVVLINAFLPNETILGKLGLPNIVGNIYAIQDQMTNLDVLISNNHYIVRHIKQYDFSINAISNSQTLMTDKKYSKITYSSKAITAKSYEIKRSLYIMQLHYIVFCLDIFMQKLGK